MKKIISSILMLSMIIALSLTAFAETSVDTVNEAASIKEYAEKYNITEDEVLHLEENLNEAKDTLKNISLAPGEEKVIPVSENINLRIESEIVSSARTVNTTINSTMNVENAFGATIITLKSVGVFQRDGISISTPIDAYGTYTAWAWNITNVNSVLGAPAYNAFVRNTFYGQLNIGGGGLNQTIQTFSYSSTINCNAAGSYYTAWR